MKYSYKDKHGKEIEAGMILKHDSGKTDIVVGTEDCDGVEGLGFRCNVLQAYPLHQFDMQEWEIVEKTRG